jgi:hypothetical protein
MPVSERLPAWLDAKTITAAVVGGVVLFAVSYAADAVLYVLNVPAAATVMNNIVIAMVGAAVLLIFLRHRHQREVMARAKERAIIVAEMNHHIRNAMTPLVLGVSSEDINERLRTLDQATDRVDYVLTDLLPTSGSTAKPRFFGDAVAPVGVGPRSIASKSA